MYCACCVHGRSSRRPKALMVVSRRSSGVVGMSFCTNITKSRFNVRYASVVSVRDSCQMLQISHECALDRWNVALAYFTSFGNILRLNVVSLCDYLNESNCTVAEAFIYQSQTSPSSVEVVPRCPHEQEQHPSHHSELPLPLLSQDIRYNSKLHRRTMA